MTNSNGRSGTGDTFEGKTAREQHPTAPSGIYADWDPEVWDFGTPHQYPVLRFRGMDITIQR